MSGFPDGWESDYDGKRWFYRYKPTGLVQYTFPQPGDEFPSFVEDGAPPVDLAPEERLVSQQQLKRKSTIGEASVKPQRKTGPTSATLFEQDDGGGDPWLQPDIFMYMGPGAYADISPLQEEEEISDTKKAEESTTLPSPPAPAAADVSPLKSPPQLEPSQISPDVSAVTTPLVIDSKPVTATPEIDSGVVVEAGDGVPAKPVSPTPPIVPKATPPLDRGVVVEAGDGIPSKAATSAPRDATAVNSGVAQAVGDGVHDQNVQMLDSREVRFSPVGFVAELPSEMTAQCHEEIHPTPVELPGNEILMEVERPVVYANAFPLAPAELHSEPLPASRIEKRDAVEQKTLSFRERELDARRQQAGIHGSAQDTSPDPYRPLIRQSTMPQPGHTSTLSSDTGEDTIQGKYVPYNPAMRAVPVEQDPTRVSDATGASKRHSLAGPPPSTWKSSDIPASLSPPIPPKTQQTQVGEVNRMENPDYGRRDSTPDPMRHPSVLQPARGRPKIVQSPPPEPQPNPKQRVDTDQVYQAYKPSRDLQQEIDDTVEMLSKTSYGPPPSVPADTSSSGRPTVSRGSTLPTDLPALPYFGVRPQMPPSAPSAPAALRNVQSHQTFSHQHHPSFTGGGEVSKPAFPEYTAPLPPSSPDLPQPLNFARKSPSPSTQNNLPTVNSSLRPQIPTEAYIVSRETTPAPPENPVMSMPITGTPSRNAGMPTQPENSNTQPPTSSAQDIQNQLPHAHAPQQRPAPVTSFGVISESMVQPVPHVVAPNAQPNMLGQTPQVETGISFSTKPEALSNTVHQGANPAETTTAQPEARKQSLSTKPTTVYSIDGSSSVSNPVSVLGADITSPQNALSPENIPPRESSLSKTGTPETHAQPSPAPAREASYQISKPAPSQSSSSGPSAADNVQFQATPHSRSDGRHPQTPPDQRGHHISPRYPPPPHFSKTSPEISSQHPLRDDYFTTSSSPQQSPPTPPPKLPHEVSPQSEPSRTTSPKPHRGSISEVIAQERSAQLQGRNIPSQAPFSGQHTDLTRGSPSPLSSHQQAVGPTPSPPSMLYASQPPAPPGPHRAYTSYTPGPNYSHPPPSHPANISQFPPPGAPMPIRPSHLPPDDNFPRRPPTMPPFHAQPPPSMGLSSQAPQYATPGPHSFSQPLYNSSQNPHMPGPLPMGSVGQMPPSHPPSGQPQFPVGPHGEVPTMAAISGRPPSMAMAPGQTQRKFSLQTYAQHSAQQQTHPTPGAPGTAPRHRFSMFSPPSIIPAHMSGGPMQVSHPGPPAMVLQGTPPQPSRPVQPVASADIQSNGTPSTGQFPQNPPPVPEEKGSFLGRLLRSDSKRKPVGSPPNTGNKLQKAQPQTGLPLSQRNPSSPSGSSKPAQHQTGNQQLEAMHASQPSAATNQYQQLQPQPQRQDLGRRQGSGTSQDLYAQHQPVMPFHMRPPSTQSHPQQQQFSQPQLQPQQRKQVVRQLIGGPLGSDTAGMGPTVHNTGNGNTPNSRPNNAPPPSAYDGSGYDGSGWGDDDYDYR